LSLTGIAAGLVLAVGAGRWLQSLLAGVSPTDPQTFAAALALVLIMALTGSLLPALRAVRIDPVVAIRED